MLLAEGSECGERPHSTLTLIGTTTVSLCKVTSTWFDRWHGIKVKYYYMIACNLLVVSIPASFASPYEPKAHQRFA
jgi:hypothetical protein